MMKRDEAVQKLATVGRLSIAHAEDLYDSFFEKPVVPQYVADWLKDNDWREDTSGTQTIFDVFDNLTLDASNGYYKDVKEWVKSNGNILAQAWVNGYTVEKEPRYTVRIKVTNQYLCNDGIGPHFSPGFRTDFTKTDLEKSGFGWVFDCEGVEVEEVE
ncbi:DUF1642 domain-containing protein [Streptococcus vestibularis]|uniref:DUF1642 domain-containing protein n=1 Tax=Streptococcus vestibularis TaxID=1343 RepID=UPI0029006DFF|nr:DUF1642 domain-containing protein [Streptococcus vestibularis]MDU1714179.1 DUF1642 domain-containing protein [Streptococcus vestibularis]MDU1829721.1 DUF1642 domain-containing protein [Streptococcus vestibularis]